MNSIEVTSFPGLDLSISTENIEQLTVKSKRYRNRRIGEFLKELQIIEAKNTGFPTIIKYTKINESILPKIETDSNRTYVTIVIPIHPVFVTIAKKDDKIKLEDKIMILLENEALTLSEISYLLGYKTVPGSLKKAILKLLNKDKIYMEGKKYIIK